MCITLLGNNGFPPFKSGKSTKNVKLMSVQHEDVIYTEITYICSLDICIKYLSRLNQVSPSLQWDSMRKGRGVSTFWFLVMLLIIRQRKNQHRTTREELVFDWNWSWTTIKKETVFRDNASLQIKSCGASP